jgi:hypothetical protein
MRLTVSCTFQLFATVSVLTIIAKKESKQDAEGT